MPSPHPVRAASPGGPPGRDGLRCGAGVGWRACPGTAVQGAGELRSPAAGRSSRMSLPGSRRRSRRRSRHRSRHRSRDLSGAILAGRSWRGILHGVFSTGSRSAAQAWHLHSRACQQARHCCISPASRVGHEARCQELPWPAAWAGSQLSRGLNHAQPLDGSKTSGNSIQMLRNVKVAPPVYVIDGISVK